MTIQRMLELLEIEHECILRNSHNACDRNCADCDLVQDDDELHEMYTDVIALLKEHEAMEQCLKTKCVICLHCDNCDVDENGLLKEQEPKPVLPVDIRPANERFATMKLGYCPKCGKKINSVDHKNYCGECSQEVKWDG